MSSWLPIETHVSLDFYSGGETLRDDPPREPRYPALDFTDCQAPCSIRSDIQFIDRWPEGTLRSDCQSEAPPVIELPAPEEPDLPGVAPEDPEVFCAWTRPGGYVLPPQNFRPLKFCGYCKGTGIIPNPPGYRGQACKHCNGSGIACEF